MLVPTVPYNPVVLILRNTSTQRWHPIVYWECTRPGTKLGDCICWKSKGHHTLGFDHREDAVKEAMDIVKRSDETKIGGFVYYYFDTDVKWDGRNVPAETRMFALPAFTKYTAQIPPII